MSATGLDTDHRLDPTWVRSQFPALQAQVNGHTAAFLDGPAGTQVPASVITAIQNYLIIPTPIMAVHFKQAAAATK